MRQITLDNNDANAERARNETIHGRSECELTFSLVSFLSTALGSVFEISIIDNEFSHRAGLLGMYGHLGITSKKVILSHPQTGHVVQGRLFIANAIAVT